MGNFRCVLVCLVVLQVAIRSTSAIVNRQDVAECIAETKSILLRQQNETRTALDESRQRKVDDARKFQDKKYVSLNTTIQKERGILLSVKKSAIDDNYDVSSCNDTTAIYRLIQIAFNASATEIAVEFQGTLNRNYTQYLFLVNQFALKYAQLEEKLRQCGETETQCFEKVRDECDNVKIQDDIERIETKFSMASEYLMYSMFTPKMENLYNLKSKDVTDHSQKLKDCYQSTKKSNGTDTNGNKNNGGFGIRSMHFLIILPILFIVLA